MITPRKITFDGLKENELDDHTKLANRAMKRAHRKLRKEYREKGLPLILADKSGKVIRVPA